MSTLYDLSRQDGLMDNARKWYLCLEENPGDLELLDQFEAWKNADPSHAEAFENIVSFWTHIDNLPEIIELKATGAQIADPTLPPDSAIIDFESKKTPSAGPGNWQKWQKFSIAATVLVIFSAIVTFYTTYLPEGAYRTATGEQKVIHLADGSIVHLNTDSRFDIDFSDDRRKVRLLEGEARFDVAKDAKRPFIVETSRGNVRAVGTSFNIYDNDETVEIIVFEGTVAVNQNDQRLSERVGKSGIGQDALLVTDGERIVAFDHNLSKVRPARQLELSQKDAWRQGKLIFKGQKLSVVIEEMSRYTNKKIVIADDILKDMKMGGVFDINDFDALLYAIEDAFPVKVIRFTPYIAVIVEA